MTERRPHWDAALIKAVFDAMVPEGTSRPMPDRAYAVIAAVEDWARWEHVPKGTLLRLERAEAAIARVRELHRPCLDPHLHDGSRCCLECSDYGRQGVVRMYPCPTIQALEGDAR